MVGARESLDGVWFLFSAIAFGVAIALYLAITGRRP